MAIALFDDFVARELPAGDEADGADAAYLPEPPTIPAATDDAVTGSWVGRAVNEGLAAEAVWLNLEQVGYRVGGAAIVQLNGAPGYVKLGEIIGGFDPNGASKPISPSIRTPGRQQGTRQYQPRSKRPGQ
ncbi:MAG: hypothetical protein ACR2QJ_10325 [Geminicoccaceae bacterium]